MLSPFLQHVRELCVKPCQRVWENTDRMPPQVPQMPEVTVPALGVLPSGGENGACLGLSKAAEKIWRVGEIPPLKYKVQVVQWPWGAGIWARGTHTAAFSDTNISQDVLNLLIPASVSPKLLFFKSVPRTLTIPKALCDVKGGEYTWKKRRMWGC